MYEWILERASSGDGGLGYIRAGVGGACPQTAGIILHDGVSSKVTRRKQAHFVMERIDLGTGSRSRM